MRKRIFSCALCILLMISNFLVVPVSASAVSIPLDGGTTDFFNWVLDAGGHVVNSFLAFFNEDVCPLAPPGVGRHSFVKQHTMVGDKTGNFYICEYCGRSAGEVGNEAYQQQVEGIQDEYGTTEFGSNGFILPIPVSVFAVGSNVKVLDSSGGYPFQVSFSGATSNSVSSVQRLEIVAEVGTAPVAGLYTLYFSGNIKNARFWNNSGSGSKLYTYSKGDSFRFPYDSSVRSCIDFVLNKDEYPIGTLSGRYYFFVEPVTYSVDDYTQNIGGINSRPTVIDGGNYGIVGDDGQIITINDPIKIINEGDKIYYNPATGQTYTITDWTYNYDGRIYNITLDTGDTVSVEYGDENITIVENNVVEGDTIVNNYTIYYMIDGSGENPDPTPGPTACPHDWQAGSSTAPTCTAPARPLIPAPSAARQRRRPSPPWATIGR